MQVMQWSLPAKFHASQKFGRKLRYVPGAFASALPREHTLSDVKVEKHDDGDGSWSKYKKILVKKDTLEEQINTLETRLTKRDISNRTRNFSVLRILISHIDMV